MAEDAVTGAQSVADAVKRVADAAVAEVHKVGPTKSYGDFPLVTGRPGGRFVIRGSGFGPGGSVHVGKSQANILSWSTQEIVGTLPTDAKDGEIVVHVDDTVKRRGQFKAA